MVEVGSGGKAPSGTGGKRLVEVVAKDSREARDGSAAEGWGMGFGGGSGDVVSHGGIFGGTGVGLEDLPEQFPPCCSNIDA